MFAILSGYKTYIAGVIAILTAVGGYLTGDMATGAAIQTGVTAVLGMTLRNGISTGIATVISQVLSSLPKTEK